MDKITRIKLNFIRELNYYFPDRFCWADCAHWALSKSINPFKIMKPKPCKIESKLNGVCYCGQYVDGKLNKK